MKLGTKALVGDILAGVAVMFLCWIAVHVTMLKTSSAVQAVELQSINKQFGIVAQNIQKQIDDHVDNDRRHKTAMRVLNEYN